MPKYTPRLRRLFASRSIGPVEVAALKTVSGGGTFHFVAVKQAGLHHRRFRQQLPRLCNFEFISRNKPFALLLLLNVHSATVARGLTCGTSGGIVSMTYCSISPGIVCMCICIDYFADLRKLYASLDTTCDCDAGQWHVHLHDSQCIWVTEPVQSCRCNIANRTIINVPK